MAKKNDETEAPRPGVVFHLTGDAMEPKEVPWGAVLRMHLPITIEAGKKRQFNFLVAPSLPCLIVPMRRLQEYAVAIEEEGEITPAGQNVTVTFVNMGKADVMLESREALVSLHPLFWGGGLAVD
jgi:hypothetical protein